MVVTSTVSFRQLVLPRSFWVPMPRSVGIAPRACLLLHAAAAVVAACILSGGEAAVVVGAAAAKNVTPTPKPTPTL
jgi:hypothetical protein